MSVDRTEIQASIKPRATFKLGPTGCRCLSAMDEPRGLRSGHLVALTGALLSLGSLWAPWYRLHIPAALRELVQQRADAVGGPAADFVRSLTALLPDSVSGDAWLVFERTDVVLALIGVLVIAVLLAAAGAFGPGVRVAGQASARITTGAGALAALTVGARILDPPGPNAYLDVRWGAWACLLGCVLMIAGGLLANDRPFVPVAVVAPPPAPPAVTGSIAPPAAPLRTG